MDVDSGCFCMVGELGVSAMAELLKALWLSSAGGLPLTEVSCLLHGCGLRGQKKVFNGLSNCQCYAFLFSFMFFNICSFCNFCNRCLIALAWCCRFAVTDIHEPLLEEYNFVK